MTLKNIAACERKRLKKLQNLTLPNAFKKTGIVITFTTFATLIVLGFIDNEPEILRDLVKKVMIAGMLLITISKDVEVDELTEKLRLQAFQMAFIAVVIYALVQPYITYLVATLIDKENKTDFLQLGDFQILFFMLLVQIWFYWLLKKMR